MTKAHLTTTNSNEDRDRTAIMTKIGRDQMKRESEAENRTIVVVLDQRRDRYPKIAQGLGTKA
jgi:hypothetical protein